MGDLKAHNDDCFKMFNPVTEASYEDEVNNWAAAVITLAQEGPWPRGAFKRS